VKLELPDTLKDEVENNKYMDTHVSQRVEFDSGQSNTRSFVINNLLSDYECMLSRI
jgi:hypothetical protein